MSLPLPKPKSITDSEVVIARADWDRITEIFEDADDLAAIEAVRDEDAAFAAQLASERGIEIAVTTPVEVIEAKLDGAHPIKAWRDYRGWTQLYLSSKSGVGRDLIAQIETRRKNGSVKTLYRLSRALKLPIEALLEGRAAE